MAGVWSPARQERESLGWGAGLFPAGGGGHVPLGQDSGSSSLLGAGDAEATA